MDGAFVGVFFFLSVFGIIYVIVTARHRERMAIIEKGGDFSLFKKSPKAGFRNRSIIRDTLNFWTFKIGMLAAGIAIGMILGTFAYWYTGDHSSNNIIPAGIMVLCGAFGLIISFFIERRIKMNDEKRYKEENEKEIVISRNEDMI